MSFSMSSHSCLLLGIPQIPRPSPSSVWWYCSWLCIPGRCHHQQPCDCGCSRGAPSGLGWRHPKNISVGKAALSASLGEIKTRRGHKPYLLLRSDSVFLRAVEMLFARTSTHPTLGLRQRPQTLLFHALQQHCHSFNR